MARRFDGSKVRRLETFYARINADFEILSINSRMCPTQGVPSPKLSTNHFGCCCSCILKKHMLRLSPFTSVNSVLMDSTVKYHRSVQLHTNIQYPYRIKDLDNAFLREHSKCIVADNDAYNGNYIKSPLN